MISRFLVLSVALLTWPVDDLSRWDPWPVGDLDGVRNERDAVWAAMSDDDRAEVLRRMRLL